MSKRSQWIANSLFLLSCFFLPWKDLGGPFGGHTASEGHFRGYYLLFTQPEGLALDSLLFMLQLMLIGVIILWTETLVRSNLEKTGQKIIGTTLAIAILAIVFPPVGEVSPIPGSLGEIEDVATGFGFLFNDLAAAVPKYIVIELIALFGLSTLLMKFQAKRIAAIPVAEPIQSEPEIETQNRGEDNWSIESAKLA